jgi:hypothetical protein
MKIKRKKKKYNKKNHKNKHQKNRNIQILFIKAYQNITLYKNHQKQRRKLKKILCIIGPH